MYVLCPCVFMHVFCVVYLCLSSMYYVFIYSLCSRQQRSSSRTPRYQPVSNESPPAYTLIDTSDFTSSEPESAPSDTEARSSGVEEAPPHRPPPPIQPPPYTP